MKAKNMLLNLLIAICVIIFLFSGYQLISYYFEYKKMDTVYSDINGLVLTDYDFNSEGLLKKAPEINMSK